MWSDVHRDRAIKLWREGQSATQIAMTLCKEGRPGTSRNAVIGILHRAGMSDSGRKKPAPVRPAGVRKPAAPARPAVVAAPAPLPEPVVVRAPEPDPSPPDGAPVTVLNVGPRHCRWPIGDPLEPGFHFCGKERAPGRPYCAEHAAIAYVKVPDKKASRRALDSLARVLERRRA